MVFLICEMACQMANVWNAKQRTDLGGLAATNGGMVLPQRIGAKPRSIAAGLRRAAEPLVILLKTVERLIKIIAHDDLPGSVLAARAPRG
jgi:hypothetical protein